jgi:hypothetical protein
MRSRLSDKGYKEYDPGMGHITFGSNKSEAEQTVKKLHTKGNLAQVVPIRHMDDGGVSYVVMYKEKGGKK